MNRLLYRRCVSVGVGHFKGAVTGTGGGAGHGGCLLLLCNLHDVVAAGALCAVVVYQHTFLASDFFKYETSVACSSTANGSKAPVASAQPE